MCKHNINYQTVKQTTLNTIPETAPSHLLGSCNMEKLSNWLVFGKRRFSVKLWKTFSDVFNCLPIAAIVGGKIFCCHGGLSPDLHNLEQIRRIRRPTDVPDAGLLCDLLWSDPNHDITGWAESNRNVSFHFGVDVVSKFLSRNELDLVCRAHEVVEDGYEFFGRRQLVTIFSAPNYCDDFNNAGGMMKVDENLTCSFQVMGIEDG
ncbi:unnamed protein product [Dicrocoelium dendriticum]|nr:unnamed protein product [Dicrocoelium dendriticum]